jgi:hypothetical protein
MATRWPFLLGFGLYAVIFLNAAVAAALGLVAGPRPWVQRFCRWTLWITGSFLALLGATLLAFAVAGIAHADVSPKSILLLVFLLCSPLLIAFLVLLTICLARVSAGARQPTL